MKILRVGDPHVKVSNLAESQKLLDFSLDLAKKEAITVVEFLGDLMHTHAIKRVEVEEFWERNLLKFSQAGITVIALVGNHDYTGCREKERQMSSIGMFRFLPNVFIINEPTNMKFGENAHISYMPYTSDKEKFVREANELAKTSNLLIAHQTFTGAVYENGFYAEEAIDPALIDHKDIISGHIHASQQIGKCFYIGTPKWDTMSDANASKGVWIYEHDASTMEVVSKKFISTESAVTPIYKYTLNEGDEEPTVAKNATVYIELKGQSSWISQVKKKYKGKAQIKSIPTDRKISANIALNDYTIKDYLANHFTTIPEITKADIFNYLER